MRRKIWNRIAWVISLIVLTVLTYSCAAKNLPTKSFPIDHPGDAIEIAEYYIGPEIKANDILTFWIVNKSEECIVFPYDLGQKIFAEINNEWKPVNNIMEYHHHNDNILNGDNPTTMVSVAPDLSNITVTAPVNFKVVLSGKLCDNKNFVVEKTIPFTVVP
jgi:uncharacterized membrane protein